MGAILFPSAPSVMVSEHAMRLHAALTLLIALMPIVGMADGPRADSRTPAAKDAYQEKIAPLLATYCFKCHTGAKAKADLRLDQFPDALAVRANADTWDKIAKNLRARLMPPEGAKEPSFEEYETIVNWIDAELAKGDVHGKKNPGRVTIRRLNRAEYNNTIRDLVGIDFQPASDFPADDVGYGFDNIGDVLSMPPMLLEKYLAAAERIMDRAMVTDPPPPPATRRFGGQSLQATIPNTGGGGRGRPFHFQRTGEIFTENEFEQEADYVLRARAHGTVAGGEVPKLAFRVDGKDVGMVEVRAIEKDPGNYEVKTRIKKGKHKLAAAFVNEFADPEAKDPAERERTLTIHYLEMQGPMDLPTRAYPETHKRIMSAAPATGDKTMRARRILERFASRAYRRPVKTEELERLVQFVGMAEKDGDTFERGIQLACQAVLVSPHFLFRVELDNKARKGEATALNDYELASRLSYFLWSSMPDDQLFDVAKEGRLRLNLEAQVKRMLKDPRAKALVENFGGQWLQFRNLKGMQPDTGRYPAYNDALRNAMEEETARFFHAIIQEDRSVLDFLDADFTFLNERLAKHYGIPGVKGEQFRKVMLKDHNRGGILTQASVLTVTSNPTRTSPVKRGKWVLDNILGTPPPPPPPDAGELKEDSALKGSLRERMEQHRAKPSCAVCHQRMDPLGFGLENFDGIGGWRDKDGAFAIDTSGTLPGGKSFQGPAELKAVLKTKSDLFTRCLAEKMLTYALGRGLEWYDKPAVDKIAAELAKDDYRFSTLVVGIVKSDPFQLRQAP